MLFTGEYFLNNALALLGYSATKGNYSASERIGAKGTELINLVYSDLWHICGEGDFIRVESVKDVINLPPKALNDVFTYGLAMFLAQSEEDGEQQSFYASLYSQKRATLSRFDKIADVLPMGGGL